MKAKQLLTILVAVLLASCMPAAANPAPTEIPIATSTTIVGFTEPDPGTWAMLMPAVREYFYYRKKAVITGNVEILWAHYPELKNGADLSNGINKEEFFINNMQGLKPFDGNIDPESYEKIKVKASNGEAEVLTHGMELYLYADGAGKFDETGGEFKIIIFMKRQNKQWAVYKTDDISGP
ncbi:MAG TPA: hypothetical protein VK249_25830 [Anaerolineales bacterium]|nr:hypothetical protein [Anaerolineales bacterium]